MDSELPAVARNVFTGCKKCGEDRYHVVLAHLSASSAKVKCEVCGSQKTYKLPSLAKAPSKRSASTRTKAPGSSRSVASAWRELHEKHEEKQGAQVSAYTLSGSFKAPCAIRHAKFGLGFVTASTPQKIDVVFEDALRSLVHNRAP